MLRARQPATQGYIQHNTQQGFSPSMHMLQSKQRNQFIRQTLRVHQQGLQRGLQVGDQAHYNQQLAGNPQATLHHMTQAQGKKKKSTWKKIGKCHIKDLQ